MKKKTIAVLAIWRDNEETLPRSLKQLESLEKKFKRVVIISVRNIS